MGTLINMLGGGSGGDSNVMLTFSISDKPGEGQIIIIPVVAGIIITIPSGMTGSKGRCDITATASAAFDVKKNNVSVGTITFAIGSNTSTFVAASDIVLEGDSSDYLKIVCPVPQDTTFADIGISLKGTKS